MRSVSSRELCRPGWRLTGSPSGKEPEAPAPATVATCTVVPGLNLRDAGLGMQDAPAWM
jgi:hypothetical protein